MLKNSLLIGWLGAVLMTVVALASNLTGGPLYNLNDMHTWQNRMIFNGMATFMHFSLMAFLVLDSHKDIGHLLVRELIVTVTLMILFLAMNQKTFALVRFNAKPFYPVHKARGGCSSSKAYVPG